MLVMPYYSGFLCFVLFLFVTMTNGLRFNRIVGGKKMDISKVPYQVSVQHKFIHHCGGSIIGPRHILTAAHCVLKGAASSYSIRAGSNYHAQKGVVVQVVKIMSHEGFSTVTADYDVAVLELEKPLNWTKKIQPISLGEEDPKPGEQILLSGWGLIEEKSNVTAHPVLQFVKLPVVGRAKCQKLYSDSIKITKAMFCAGYLIGVKDTCQGDSGGPAVLHNKQVGIVSWGRGCGRKLSPGVYANVIFLRNWIQSKLSETNF